VLKTNLLASHRIGVGLAAILLLAGVSNRVYAMDIRKVTTEYINGEYRLSMTATLNAPADRVETVLRDYARYNTLDSRILDAHVVARTGVDEVKLFTRIRVCFTFLCRNVDRTELVMEKPLELEATVVPQASDAERGATHTVLKSEGATTLVEYHTSIVPKFWVPALFGRSMMLRTLRDATTSMFEHIEKRAQP
jgi:hypothetical protein